MRKKLSRFEPEFSQCLLIIQRMMPKLDQNDQDLIEKVINLSTSRSRVSQSQLRHTLFTRQFQTSMVASPFLKSRLNNPESKISKTNTHKSKLRSTKTQNFKTINQFNTSENLNEEVTENAKRNILREDSESSVSNSVSMDGRRSHKKNSIDVGLTKSRKHSHFNQRFKSLSRYNVSNSRNIKLHKHEVRHTFTNRKGKDQSGQRYKTTNFSISYCSTDVLNELV